MSDYSSYIGENYLQPSDGSDSYYANLPASLAAEVLDALGNWAIGYPEATVAIIGTDASLWHCLYKELLTTAIVIGEGRLGSLRSLQFGGLTVVLSTITDIHGAKNGQHDFLLVSDDIPNDWLQELLMRTRLAYVTLNYNHRLSTKANG